MAGPQYTKCIQPDEFEPYNLAWLALVIPIVGATITFFIIVAEATVLAASLLVGWGLLALLIDFMYYTLDWMLNRKLICLYRKEKECGDGGNQVCAIGAVGDFELVGEDKNPIEDVDNDFCINLVLAPVDWNTHHDMAANGESADKNDAIALDAKRGAIQADLITRQPNMPKYGGYRRTFIWFGPPDYWGNAPGSYPEYISWSTWFKNSDDPDAQNEEWKKLLLHDWWVKPKKYTVPVLHCEFEGSRIADVLNAIDAASFGGEWCKKNFVFKLICRILRALFAPSALANAVAAWFSASPGSMEDALVDPGEEVHFDDMVIMQGRWVFDGGHSGYNEMHAVRLLQKIYYVPTVIPDAPDAQREKQIEAFKSFRDRWCSKLCEVPPIGPGSHTMTPAQTAVFEAQQRPQNGWVLHPVIDSCLPPAPYEPPVIH